VLNCDSGGARGSSGIEFFGTLYLAAGRLQLPAWHGGHPKECSEKDREFRPEVGGGQ
jgi:hypothetical protein